MGIVAKADLDDPKNEGLNVIEGDNGDCVAYHDYAPDDPAILGYGSLALARERWLIEGGRERPLEDGEPPAQKAEKIPEAAPEPPPTAMTGYTYALTASDKDYTVTVGYNDDAAIPENAVLVVTEKVKGTPAYEERYRQTKEVLAEKDAGSADLNMENDSVDVEEQYGLESARIFNVEIQVNGAVIEPNTAVLVQIAFENESDAGLGCVLHFADSGTELLDGGAVTSYTAEDGASVVEFQLESFSDIVVTPSPGAYAWFDPTNGGITFYNGVSSGSRTRANATGGYVTIPTPVSTTTYGYTLKGWLDINSGAYYDRGTDNFAKHDKDPGMTGVQIPVGTNNTVFYADWVATNYNVGLSSHRNQATSGNTSNFVKTHVFDYNELFNYRSMNFTGTPSGSTRGTETWSMPATPKAGSLDFVFTDAFSAGSAGRLSRVSNPTPPNTWTGATGSGYTGKIYRSLLADPTYGAARRSALFDPISEPGKNYLGTGDGLYLYNAANGYYYYDSSKNSASYNQDDQRFYVYNDPVFVTNTNSTNRAFLPFNYASGTNAQKTFTRNNGTVNYFFGLGTEIDFYLPNAAGTGGNKDIKGQDMVFKFSGDDDIWIFCDDTLVLDLGGIHDIFYGEINFTTGIARTAEQGAAITTPNDTIGYGSGGVVTTTDIKHLLPPGEHKLTIYYLERGGNLSNYRAYFNIAPRFGLELSKKDADGNAAASSLLDGAQFSLYSDLACTIPVELWHSEAEKNSGAAHTNTFAVVDGKAALWGLAVGQTYFLKETRSPGGYIPSDSVIVELTLRNDGSMGVPVIHNAGSWTFLQNYKLDDLTHKVTFDIQNKWSHYVDVTVGKTWLNEAGDPMTGTRDVTVNLYRSATKTPDGSLPPDAVLVDSGVTLTSAGGYSHTWTNLDSAGTTPSWHPWYYYVVEHTLSSYVTSYANNGVIGGTITVTNRKESLPYELPQTGGTGTIPYTMSGVLLLLGAGLMYKKKLFRKGGRDSPGPK